MLDKGCSPLCGMHCLVCVLSGPVALVCTPSMKTLQPTLPCNRQALMGLPSPTTLEQVCSFSHSVKLIFSLKAQAWKRLGYAIFRGSLTEFLRKKNISAGKRGFETFMLLHCLLRWCAVVFTVSKEILTLCCSSTVVRCQWENVSLELLKLLGTATVNNQGTVFFIKQLKAQQFAEIFWLSTSTHTHLCSSCD